MHWDFEKVTDPFSFTEGPAWDGEAVLFTDIPNSRIMRYKPDCGECTVYRTRTNGANGLMFDKTGRLYGCEGSGRRIVRYDRDGTTTVIADKFEEKRLNSPNDLAFDNQGCLWFTDPRYGDKTDDLELDHQSVFRLDNHPCHVRHNKTEWALNIARWEMALRRPKRIRRKQETRAARLSIKR